MHNGFVVDAEGEKMSKSLGNVSNLLDLIEHVRPAGLPHGAAAVALPQPDARSPATTIDAAVNALAGLDSFAARTSGRALPPIPTPTCSTRSAPRWTTTSTRPKATALLFDTVRRANAALDAGDAMRAGARRRGPRDLRPRSGWCCSAAADVPAEVADKAAALDAARAAKDFATADAIRAELQADGWTVETTKPAPPCDAIERRRSGSPPPPNRVHPNDGSAGRAATHDPAPLVGAVG